jgi:hypothetical protein
LGAEPALARRGGVVVADAHCPAEVEVQDAEVLERDGQEGVLERGLREGVDQGLRLVRGRRRVGDGEGVFPGDREDGSGGVAGVGVVLVLGDCEAEDGFWLGEDFVGIY